MKKILCLLIFIAVFIGCSSNSDKENVSVNENMKWEYNLSQAQKISKSENKPLIIDFYADWCTWCKKLDRDVYSKNEIVDLSEKFVCAKIDTDKYQSEAIKYGVRGLPTIVFLDSKGNIVQKIIGYRDAEYFMRIMKEVLDA